MMGHERKCFKKVGKVSALFQTGIKCRVFVFSCRRSLDSTDRETDVVSDRGNSFDALISVNLSRWAIVVVGGAGHGWTQARCRISRMNDAELMFSATREADSRCCSWSNEVHTSGSREHTEYSRKRGRGRVPAVVSRWEFR
jgi:hypothetical protein